MVCAIFAKRAVVLSQVSGSTPDTVTSHVIVGDTKLPIEWNSFHTLGLAMALRRNVKFGMDYSPVLTRPAVWGRNPSNQVNSSPALDLFNLTSRLAPSSRSGDATTPHTIRTPQIRPIVQVPAHDPASLFLAADQILALRTTDAQSPITAQAPAAAAAPPHRIALSHGWPGKSVEASTKAPSPRAKTDADDRNLHQFLPSPYPHAVPVLWPLSDVEHMHQPMFWPVHAIAPFPGHETTAVHPSGPVYDGGQTSAPASTPTPVSHAHSPRKRTKPIGSPSTKPTKRKKVRRLEYICGKCGQVKKGHVCTNPRDDGNPWV